MLPRSSGTTGKPSSDFQMRLFYRKIWEKTKSASDRLFVIHNPNSSIKNPSFSSSKIDYLKYWLKYLTKVFAKKDFPSFILPKNAQSRQSEDSPITRGEVKSAIQVLKNLKASGIDEVTNEDIKHIELLKPNTIHFVLQKIWGFRNLPRQLSKIKDKPFSQNRQTR